MSYVEMKEQLQDIEKLGASPVDPIRESFFERVKEAHTYAMREGIRVNSIIINKNMVKVPVSGIQVPIGGAVILPEMVCGLNVYLTKDELPDGYSFALTQTHGNRLEEFESIGMEPDELRKAAELYKRVKEIL